MDKVLDKLIKAFGVSGYEQEVKEIIKEELNEYKADLFEDKLGNLICKLGKGDKKLMVCANMDQIGFIVTYIEDNNYLKVENIGDFKVSQTINSLVKLCNEDIGRLLRTEREEYYIDLGLNSKDKTPKDIREGTAACFISNIVEANGKIIGAGLNNRVGCYILLRLIKQIVSYNKEVYFVFSSEKELGGRGARAAAYEVNPDYCIVVDLQNSDDIPNGSNIIELGSGPISIIKDRKLIMHHEIKDMIDTAAKQSNINIQYSVSNELSDGGAIHTEREGIKTGRISVPCRYMYTSSEMVSVEDIENTIKLLIELI